MNLKEEQCQQGCSCHHNYFSSKTTIVCRLSAWKKCLKGGEGKRGRNKIWDCIISFLTVTIWNEIQTLMRGSLCERFSMQKKFLFFFFCCCLLKLRTLSLGWTDLSVNQTQAASLRARGLTSPLVFNRSWLQLHLSWNQLWGRWGRCNLGAK